MLLDFFFSLLHMLQLVSETVFFFIFFFVIGGDILLLLFPVAFILLGRLLIFSISRFLGCFLFTFIISILLIFVFRVLELHLIILSNLVIMARFGDFDFLIETEVRTWSFAIFGFWWVMNYLCWLLLFYWTGSWGLHMCNVLVCWNCLRLITQRLVWSGHDLIRVSEIADGANSHSRLQTSFFFVVH